MFEMLKLFKIIVINAFGLKDHDLNSLKDKFGQPLLFVCIVCVVCERESARACVQEKRGGDKEYVSVCV